MKIVNRKELLFLNFMAYSLIGNAGVIQLDNPKGEDGKVLTITNVCKVARVTGEALPGESIYNPNNTGSDLMFMVQTLE